MPDATGNTQTPPPQPNAGTPAGQATPTPAQAIPLNTETLAKLQEKANAKYGGDINKAIEGLGNAEAKMHEATTERNKVEERLKSLEAELENAKRQQNNGFIPQGQPNDLQRQQVEAEYGRPYDEVVANFKIAEMAQLPTLELLSNMQIKDIKQELKATDPYFTDAVAQKFETLIRSKHPRDRVIPQIIKECADRAKAQSIEEIVNAKVQEQLKTFTGGNPQNPPSTNAPTGATAANTKTLPRDMTEDIVIRIARQKYGSDSPENVAKVKEEYSE